MTIQEAVKLTKGQVLHHVCLKNADGTPQRFKVNGKVRTWKRDPNRVEVPLKRGMYEFHTITDDLDQFYIP